MWDSTFCASLLTDSASSVEDKKEMHAGTLTQAGGEAGKKGGWRPGGCRKRGV